MGTPFKRRKHRRLGTRKRLFNRHHAQVRALGEQGAATLKDWHVLRKARCSPARITTIVQVILALHHHTN
ncbi:transposase family protein [Thermomonospora echinospora]|uniref:transposase family protein n=1 Tax=Thermomonospora echinospora TaxID=1992 RepID=UPI000CDED330